MKLWKVSLGTYLGFLKLFNNNLPFLEKIKQKFCKNYLNKNKTFTILRQSYIYEHGAVIPLYYQSTF